MNNQHLHAPTSSKNSPHKLFDIPLYEAHITRHRAINANQIVKRNANMPQLPSGRHVGIHCLSPDDIIRKVSDTHPEVSLLTLGMKVKEIDSLETIKPFITILFVRKSQSADRAPLDKRSQTIPEDTESYDSGYTLADQALFTADWSEEDKQAFTDFLESEKVASYFQDVLNQMQTTGIQYQQNLFGLMNEVCGTDDDSADTDTPSDDYDLLVAHCIFADMTEPEEPRQRDLWYRMNAIRRHWEKWIPELSKVRKDISDSPREAAQRLRDSSALSICTEDERNWMHKQNVVFANDLFDLYEPEVLIGINREAYGIVKTVALAEPTH